MNTFLRILCFVLVISTPIFFPNAAFGERGDSTKIKVFDKYLWTWYGSQNRWGVFPSKEKRHERIFMNFTLTCPKGGCGEWDYTMRVYARTRTGRIDSNLVDAPLFTKAGAVSDSLRISLKPTFKTKFNASTKKTDTVSNPPFQIYFYRNDLQPFTVTDSMPAYEATYWNYSYSSTGGKIDSTFIVGDTTLLKGSRKAYKPFEVVNETEIGRFITPYGKWHNENWNYTWTYDVTDYAHILKDSTEIKVFYDGWSQGSLFDLDFTFIEGIPARETYAHKVFWSGNPTYGDPNNPIENFLKEQSISRLRPQEHVTLRLMTTGHGFGGTDNAAEFSRKNHKILINGNETFEQDLWRGDCGQNPIYPQAGTWYYNRAGWCPGDIVEYWDYHITQFFSKSDTVRVGYQMEPYENQNLAQRASYIIEGQVLYSNTNYVNNASLEAIKMPNNAYRFRRMNPICSGQKPIIVVKNHGTATLSAFRVRYRIDNGEDQYFLWSGNIPFMEEAEIELPPIDFPSGDHTFEAQVFEPNGRLDESDIGDKKVVSFTNPKQTTSGKVALMLKTDIVSGIPNGIRYEVLDSEGYVIKERGNFQDGATIRDTFDLEDGCYKFVLYDEALGDGLFPIFQGSTRGFYSLREVGGSTIIFNSQAANYGQPSGIYASFGDREIIPFIVNRKALSIEQSSSESAIPEIRVVPNPTIAGIASLQVSGLPKDISATLQVVSSIGEIIHQEQVSTTDLQMIPLTLKGQPSGAYFIRISYEGAMLHSMFMHSAE
ncbi:MAG: peptide-N-glycosidase F-related protein [Candidatus Kapaibacteriota bacterium]